MLENVGQLRRDGRQRADEHQAALKSCGPQQRRADMWWTPWQASPARYRGLWPDRICRLTSATLRY